MTPLLKWPGGKRALAERIRRTYDAPPPKRYVEGCCGGVAVFLARRASGELRGKEVVLVDIEARLMAFYRGVQAHAEAVLEAMNTFTWGLAWRDVYGEERARFSAWTPAADEIASPVDAARMLWMNRACFNGLYRVNSDGEFNAPAGSYQMLARPTRVEVLGFAEVLAGVRLVTAHVAPFIDAEVGEGDQLYVDPPYDDSFDQYTAGRFPWSMQVDLAQTSARARDRGAFPILSNANTPRVAQLYLGLGFDLRGISAQRSIGASADSRGKERELLLIGRPAALEAAAPKPARRRSPAQASPAG